MQPVFNAAPVSVNQPNQIVHYKNKTNDMKTITSALTALMLLSACAAFTQPGSLDSSFGSNGKVVKPTGSAGTFDHSLAIQQDGKIIVTGTSFNGINNDVILVRYKLNGSLDKSFGVNGITVTDLGSGEGGNAVAVQTDGKILVTGNSVLLRYRSNGLPDSSFGAYGKIYIPITGNCVAVQANGKILVGGNGGDCGTPGGCVSVARYNTVGSADSSFGTDGIVSIDITDPPEHFGHGIATSITILQKGKILLAGNNYDEGPGSGIVIARFTRDGKVDSSFGQIHQNSIFKEECYSVGIQSNGKILLAGTGTGYLSINGWDFDLRRLNPDGSFDTNFGTGGIVRTDFNYWDFGKALRIQPDGKILIAGYTSSNNSDYNFALARYKSNGRLDKTFGIKGKVITQLDGEDYAYSIALQQDGKIVVGGSSGTKFALVRYDGDTVLLNNNTDDIASNIISLYPSAGLKIYPNPVESILNIEFNKIGAVQKRINIFDVNGKLLISKLCDGNTALNVKQLIAGTYLIKMNDENGKELYNGKVIKQ